MISPKLGEAKHLCSRILLPGGFRSEWGGQSSRGQVRIGKQKGQKDAGFTLGRHGGGGWRVKTRQAPMQRHSVRKAEKGCFSEQRTGPAGGVTGRRMEVRSNRKCSVSALLWQLSSSTKISVCGFTVTQRGASTAVHLDYGFNWAARKSAGGLRGNALFFYLALSWSAGGTDPRQRV